ncbi:ABC transporter permease [Flavobacterium sp. xlx-214]|uniref:cell division protein FtsX n=1 Tax=unclassified Flavobacterium TaxID=196869 RepID=UPI0013D0A4BA|nr:MULTISPECIES: permease-like cell division protein FtsX [unclassified Flavobacterium]MBA5793852.1 ABC transporter permease [Flavobacterium sp. xlx-221]QMI84846.1 ABC transporter permease [Flavobacterium sp. xlx-214]
MATSYEKYQKRRLLSSYFSVILSIFLVLFLLGSLGMFVINYEKISNNFKENIPMSIYIKENTTDEQLATYQADLEKQKFLKDLTFVHKDSAANVHQKTIGEDFVKFLGFNPLQHSYDLHFNGEYVEKDSIKKIEIDIKENPIVDEVVYDAQLVDLVNKNIKTISFWVLVISGVFAFISMLLINSSLRLSIYSKRFIIKTMQMVGATKSFIRKPFIWNSVKLGMIGSVLAIIGILALTAYADNKLPTLGLMSDVQSIALVCAAVFLLGIVITYISTYFATQRFLNLKSDDLYL